MHESVEREREKIYKKWKNSGRNEDRISWKRARAIATRTFEQSKQQDMQQYLESMKVNTPPAKIYEKLRKMRDRPPRRINVKQGWKHYFGKSRHCKCLAEAFAKVSDSSNCSTKFKIIKERKEKKCTDFNGNNMDPYNKLFTMKELTSAIGNTKNTAPEPDRIHYRMFRHLLEIAKQQVLHVFNQLWISSCFRDRWKDSLTIPIAKPDKEHSNPNNYRLISLTS